MKMSINRVRKQAKFRTVQFPSPSGRGCAETWSRGPGSRGCDREGAHKHANCRGTASRSGVASKQEKPGTCAALRGRRGEGTRSENGTQGCRPRIQTGSSMPLFLLRGGRRGRRGRLVGGCRGGGSCFASHRRERLPLAAFHDVQRDRSIPEVAFLVEAYRSRNALPA